MKTKKNSVFFVLVVGFLLAFSMKMNVNAATYTGSCGTDVNWTLDSETGLLTISGTGAIKDYELWGSPFYKNYKSVVKKVVIEDGVTGIGNCAFYDLNYLTEVVMAESVTRIGENAFYSCEYLKDVDLSDNITTIEKRAFHLCDRIVTIDLPRALITLGPGVFESCNSIKNVTFHDGITTIGTQAFVNCYSLKSIVLPPSVKTIGTWAFSGATSLESVRLSEGIEVLPEYVFQGCTKLKSINFPSTLKTIDVAAFSQCSILKGVCLPEGLTKIAERAFYGTSIEHLIIPESVTYIGQKAFQYCSDMEKIAILNPDATIYNHNASLGKVGVTTVYGHTDSTAKTYANKYDFSFKTIIEDNLWTDYMEYINPFKDVTEGKFYYDPVLWVVENGITTGMSADTFSPEGICTRGQVVTFLWRANGKPEPMSTECAFVDVNEDAYYYKAMLWAVENGITLGVNSTKFAPNNTCTRGQIVTFLWRANGESEATTTECAFVDVNEDAYYYKAMLWAVENGITLGVNSTKFAPNNTCTRGQVVTFLYRAETL